MRVEGQASGAWYAEWEAGVDGDDSRWQWRVDCLDAMRAYDLDRDREITTSEALRHLTQSQAT